MRTPPTEQREPVGERDPGGTRDPVHSPAGSPRDYSLLSEPHMASPLSSTKLDGAGIIAHDAVTDVATRLFAGESGEWRFVTRARGSCFICRVQMLTRPLFRTQISWCCA